MKPWTAFNALLILAAISLFGPLSSASARPREKAYAEAWCREHHGRSEVVLSDRSRCDCLTAHYAVKVEFAPNWKNAVGQALHYARLTRRAPAVVLILTRPGDKIYAHNLRELTRFYQLPLIVLTIGDEP